MSYNYEELYRTTPNALGDPTGVFVDFFADHAGAGLSVLDIGCGQGRDALFIARAGHRVLGVDLAPSAIRDLTAAATREALDLRGEVADIIRYTPPGQFDVVLIDRTLHMLDTADRLAVLDRLLGHVVPGGWCLIADERANIAGFKRVVHDHADPGGQSWQTVKDTRGYLFVRRPG